MVRKGILLFLMVGWTIPHAKASQGSGDWAGSPSGRPQGLREGVFRIEGPPAVLAQYTEQKRLGGFADLKTLSRGRVIPSATFIWGYDDLYKDPELLLPEIRACITNGRNQLLVFDKGGVGQIFREIILKLKINEQFRFPSGAVYLEADFPRSEHPLTEVSTRVREALDLAMMGTNVRIIVAEGGSRVFRDVVDIWTEAQRVLPWEGPASVHLDLITGLERAKTSQLTNWQGATDGGEFIASYFGLAQTGPITGRVFLLSRDKSEGRKTLTGLEDVTRHYPERPTGSVKPFRPDGFGFHMAQLMLMNPLDEVPVADLARLRGISAAEVLGIRIVRERMVELLPKMEEPDFIHDSPGVLKYMSKLTEAFSIHETLLRSRSARSPRPKL